MSVLGYKLPVFEFEAPPELSGDRTGSYAVVVVGAGLAGLTLAAELASRGTQVVVLERGASLGVVGIASRGIAYAKRTLQIFDRLGIAERLKEKGQTWNEGSIFDGLDEIYHFTIQPDADQKWPAFINLQQFYVEEFLIDRIRELGNVDLRWRSRVIAAEQRADALRLTVGTPEGEYSLEAQWVAACDGARSAVRQFLGIETPLAQLEDTWAIVDVKTDMPGLQRQIWLNSPFIKGGAVVLHPMADGVVRADWQIGQLDDPEAEVGAERVRERLAAILGGASEFDVVSISKWSYRRRVMDRLRHGRAMFLGDAAHEIPPFGARGGNSGIQDAENLAWKLQAILEDRATPALLDTFADERGQAAVENARMSCAAQAFITPRTAHARVLRDAVIGLARDHDCGRALVNTGRPSTPTVYATTALNVEDADYFDGGPGPGAAAEDGRFDGGFLLDRRGDGFLALHFLSDHASRRQFESSEIRGFKLDHIAVPRRGDTEVIHRRYGVRGEATYVLRPDSHIAGRTVGASATSAAAIVERAMQQADPR